HLGKAWRRDRARAINGSQSLSAIARVLQGRRVCLASPSLSAPRQRALNRRALTLNRRRRPAPGPSLRLRSPAWPEAAARSPAGLRTGTSATASGRPAAQARRDAYGVARD